MRSLAIFLLLSQTLLAQNIFNNQSLQPKNIYSSSRNYQNHFFQTDNLSHSKHYYSPINYFGQVAVGSGLSLMFAFFPFAAAFGYAWENDGSDFIGTSLSILTISSYLFGAATGVHWVARSENEALSYWKTFGYSIIGGGAGAILAVIIAKNYHYTPWFGGTLVALSPVIGSMFYASFISDWRRPERNDSISMTSFSHQDLIEQSEIVRIEFLRVRF